MSPLLGRRCPLAMFLVLHLINHPPSCKLAQPQLSSAGEELLSHVTAVAIGRVRVKVAGDGRGWL